MGKKILISYGNKLYYNSLLRLKNEAENIKIFDKVIIYTDKDLPDEIILNPLYKYERGGGYWVWKPWVIYHTLQKLNDDDILVYCDSGNELYENKEWEKWWSLMKKYNGIFFSYGATMEERCKKELLQHFDEIRMLKHFYQLMGSLIIVNKKALITIKEWLDIMLQKNELVTDVPPENLRYESRKFIEHRHDQSVLSCVVYKREKLDNLKILWQHSEYRDRNGQAVFIARISDEQRRSSTNYEPISRTILKNILITPYRKLRMFFLKTINIF